MDFTYVTIIVLASMIFALAGMMGYMYWQQTRMLQHIQSLSSFMSSHIVQSQQQEEEHVHEEPEAVPEPKEAPQPEQEDSEDDDRLSVDEKVEVVQGPPAVEDKSSSGDIDDLQDKTAAQLRELLTEKGIPFGKRDSKPVLLQLLKAIA